MSRFTQWTQPQPRKEGSAAHWQANEWASFAFHLALVLIPFGISIYFQYHFYDELFTNSAMPVLLIALVEVPAIAMVVFFIRGIASRFLWLRHAVPFVSALGLAHGLHLQLQDNNPFVAWLATIASAVAIMVVMAMALASIEDLFVSPLQAAERKATQQVQQLHTSFATLQALMQSGGAIVQDYNATVQAVANLAAPPQQHAAPSPVPVVVEAVSPLQLQDVPMPPTEDAPPIVWDNKSATVRGWKAAGLSLQQLLDATRWERTAVAPLWSKSK